MRPVRRARAGGRRTRSTRWIPVLVALTLAAVLTPAATGASAATSVATSAARSATPRSSLAWKDCGGGFQCATLTVPLDPSNPEAAVDGPTLDLAVIRTRARDPDARIGSLVLNPGGPGVPAVQFLRTAASSLPAEVRDRFDLVAFDPRGVGESEPIECADSLDPVFDQSFQPATAAARLGPRGRGHLLGAAVRGAQRQISSHTCRPPTRCATSNSSVSPWGIGASRTSATPTAPTSVRATPRRIPIGCERSCSTGPSTRRCRRARSPSGRLAASSTRSTTSWPTAPTIAGCAFHHGGDAEAAYDALRAEAARAPLATDDPDGRTLNQTRLDAAVLQQLYLGRAAWSGLANALADAEEGDASTLLAGADAFVGRTDGGARRSRARVVLGGVVPRRPRGDRRRRGGPAGARGGGGRAPDGRVHREQQPSLLGLAGAGRAARGSAHRRGRAADPGDRDDRGPGHPARAGAFARAARSSAGVSSWPTASSTPASTTATSASTRS